MRAPIWSGAVVDRPSVIMGPLALFLPLLEKMDVAAIIDRHLPPDPQLEYSHGQVLSLLLAARLCRPTALVNIPAWAEESGADLLWGIPVDKLNDDRLGRALDALFTQRHSIQASVAAHAVSTFGLPTDRIHFDPTHLFFYGAYENSKPRSSELPLPPKTPSVSFSPAHVTYGYAVHDTRMIQVGVCAVVDDLGAVPIFGHVLSGNSNGHTAIAEQFQLLQNYLPLDSMLMISDRGTFSEDHVARLHRAGHSMLCSIPWHEVRTLFDQNRDRLCWKPASFLSVEQRRRRKCPSKLPVEEYQLAVLRYHVTDPEKKEHIPCRILFVFSSADQKVCQKQRQRSIDTIRQGLETIAHTVAAGHRRHSDPDRIQRRIAKLLGQRAAARYFRWQLVPLTPEEQKALPPPKRGCRLATHRLEFEFDEQAVQSDAIYDGYSALLSTAPLAQSGDLLFSQFKQQCYLEDSHHQWKTPLAVRPLFLKSPQRIEALVYLLQITLTAYQLLQRCYRQAVPEDAPLAEKRFTTERLARAFSYCPLFTEKMPMGCVVHPCRVNQRQRDILNRLNFPHPSQLVPRRLPRYPPK
jgi:transposase